MSECRYVPQEQRAANLIEKGVRAWQEIQRLAMAEDELLDSIVLLGQELWLPHHETDPSKFGVTLRIGVHYPQASRESAEAQVSQFFRQLEAEASDGEGWLRIGPESRPSSICMIVTPVSESPFSKAHWIGAAPRYFGRMEV